MTSTINGARTKQTSTRRISKATLSQPTVATHADIAQRARELYEASGCQGGRDLEFWLEAERQLHRAQHR